MFYVPYTKLFVGADQIIGHPSSLSRFPSLSVSSFFPCFSLSSAFSFLFFVFDSPSPFLNPLFSAQLWVFYKH